MLKKYFYIALGSISLLIGIIGIVLPILPTTPLLLLSCYCYSKSSDKFYRWLISTKIYNKYGKDFIENKQLTLKRKIFLLSFASIMLLFPLIILSCPLKLLIITVYIYLYYYFIFNIKTIRRQA